MGIINAETLQPQLKLEANDMEYFINQSKYFLLLILWKISKFTTFKYVKLLFLVLGSWPANLD